MISTLHGTVLSVGATAAVIETGGVGMKVLSTPTTLADLRHGATVRVHTHLVVREDSLTLFGFGTEHERDTFEALQSVQGVGPRLALAMLAVHSPDALAQAVASGDRKALEQVPGIGAKVAARLLLEPGRQAQPPRARRRRRRGASLGGPRGRQGTGRGRACQPGLEPEGRGEGRGRCG
ncbi:Holliday junction branch migration protein RuvA [Demequina litorisediminis]|uniref:Holliday junction branch migration complex subunit RuvA n=1 Tax=Demequina litorisediminis TaxID=1849022 RepID=A0ABQ6IKB3_9MICO|nr:Holliday junction branch migration protein RuvA [Demequina litorisediminis]GMA37755.1 hypothetical protein GCM10025876_39590 [Demequina litorisediminis]